MEVGVRGRDNWKETAYERHERERRALRGGGVVKEALARAHRGLDIMRLLVLDEGANGPMDDTFGPSGRARGIQDVHGMVGGQLRKDLRRSLVRRFDELSIALRGRNIRELESMIWNRFKDNYALESW